LEAYPLLFSIIIWGSSTFEALLRSNFPLLPIFAATSHNPRRVCVSLLYLPPSFRLQSLGLSTPATTTGIVVFAVLITYLTAAFAPTELSALFIPSVQITTNYPFVEFCSTDVS